MRARIHQKLNEAQKHRRKTVNVHCYDTENDRSSCGIFSFCKQQTQTEFALCETELSLHFNSVGIILRGDLLLSLAVCSLLRSSGFLAGKSNAEYRNQSKLITPSQSYVARYSSITARSPESSIPFPSRS